jgi:large subunit ribosomal protein L25
MKQMQIEAKRRTASGKGPVSRLRGQQIVPAVLYGRGSEPQNLELSGKLIQQVLNTPSLQNMLVQLSILDPASPQQETVMVREIQRHPVSSKVLHVDFVKIAMDQVLETHVPVVITGTAPGVKEGGILEVVHRELLVRCLPTLIPENFTVDVSALMIGDGITVRDLALPEGIQVLVESHEPIVHVVAPRMEEEKPAADAAAVVAAAPEAPKEPEVIGEKEREERRAAKDKDKKAE